MIPHDVVSKTPSSAPASPAQLAAKPRPPADGGGPGEVGYGDAALGMTSSGLVASLEADAESLDQPHPARPPGPGGRMYPRAFVDGVGPVTSSHWDDPRPNYARHRLQRCGWTATPLDAHQVSAPFGPPSRGSNFSLPLSPHLPPSRSTICGPRAWPDARPAGRSLSAGQRGGSGWRPEQRGWRSRGSVEGRWLPCGWCHCPPIPALPLGAIFLLPVKREAPMGDPRPSPPAHPATPHLVPASSMPVGRWESHCCPA